MKISRKKKNLPNKEKSTQRRRDKTEIAKVPSQMCQSFLIKNLKMLSIKRPRHGEKLYNIYQNQDLEYIFKKSCQKALLGKEDYLWFYEL